MNFTRIGFLGIIAASFFAACSNDDDSPILPTNPCTTVSLTNCQTCSNQGGNAVITDTCTTETTPQPGGSIQVVKSGLIEGNETWSADSIYLLSNKVVVSDGATLTIEPGTIVKGKAGLRSLASSLIVARGGKIFAEGTASKPIIFTSEEDNIQPGELVGTNLDENDNGRWGGLIILGSAPISASSGDTAQIEGIPADEPFGSYGGTNIEDNSGILRYVSVRHGGAEIGEGNEINGITFGGVGSGTIVENIEVVANKDDGIEFFGGSVNVTNAVVWAADDDGYDIDQTYSGTVDNFVFVGFGGSDHALEIDGPESSLNADGKFTLKNGTLKGGAEGEMADLRDGAQGLISNCFFYNFREGADIEIDEALGHANFVDSTLNVLMSEFVSADDLDRIFENKADVAGADSLFNAYATRNNAKIEASAKTKGADTSLFSWTMSAIKNAF